MTDQPLSTQRVVLSGPQGLPSGIASFAAMLAILSIVVSAARAEEFTPWGDANVIAVICQLNPWGGDIPSDTPRIAIFENGDVLQTKTENGQPVTRAGQLSGGAFADARGIFAPVFALPTVDEFYSIDAATDQPVAVFYFRKDDREIRTAVWGLTEAGPRGSIPEAAAGPSGAPVDLLIAHKLLLRLKIENMREWEPKYIEVMFDPAPADEGAVIPWPAEWPGLDSERAFETRGSWSIFLDFRMLAEVRALIRTVPWNGAILLDGKKRTAWVRNVFPGANYWGQGYKPLQRGGRPETEGTPEK